MLHIVFSRKSFACAFLNTSIPINNTCTNTRTRRHILKSMMYIIYIIFVNDHITILRSRRILFSTLHMIVIVIFRFSDVPISRVSPNDSPGRPDPCLLRPSLTQKHRSYMRVWAPVSRTLCTHAYVVEPCYTACTRLI